MKRDYSCNKLARCFLGAILAVSMLASIALPACASDNGSIPADVMDARNTVVHVYVLFYKDGNLIAYKSGAGIIGFGMELTDGSANWKYVFTSLNSIDPSSMKEEYDRYRTIVLADGVVYEVGQVAYHKLKNRDFAVLFLDQKIPNRKNAVLQSVDNLKSGDRVYAIGFPEPAVIYDPQYESFAEEEVILQGSILGTDYEKNQVNYIPASMAVSENLTGGALVDQNGYLVGMISSYRDGGCVFAITANDIFDILMDFNLPISATKDYKDLLQKEKPSAADLDKINADIVYPRKDSYYLDSYETRYVRSSAGKEGVYCFKDPATKNGVMRSGNYFVVKNRTEVIVLARAGGYSCVLIPSMNSSGWINSDYLVS